MECKIVLLGLIIAKMFKNRFLVVDAGLSYNYDIRQFRSPALPLRRLHPPRPARGAVSDITHPTDIQYVRRP